MSGGRGHRRLVHSCAVRTGSRVYLHLHSWERVRTHLGLGEPLGLLVLLRHAHRGGLWMWSLVGGRGQRCGLVRCIERGAVDARVFRSAALARFIQSTWLDFPREGRDGEGTHPLGATRDTGAANVGHARGDSAREADGRHLSSFLYTGRRRDK